MRVAKQQICDASSQEICYTSYLKVSHAWIVLSVNGCSVLPPVVTMKIPVAVFEGAQGQGRHCWDGGPAPQGEGGRDQAQGLLHWGDQFKPVANQDEGSREGGSHCKNWRSQAHNEDPVNWDLHLEVGSCWDADADGVRTERIPEWWRAGWDLSGVPRR